MNTNSLVTTNPYLKDANNRKRLVQRSVRTSCGVAGILEKTGEVPFITVPSRGEKRIYKNSPK